jgi:hypothetical protein
MGREPPVNFRLPEPVTARPTSRTRTKPDLAARSSGEGELLRFPASRAN